MNSVKVKDFHKAIEVFPENLKDIFLKIDNEIKENTWEIRLRNNLPIMFVGNYGKKFICKDAHLAYINSDNTIKSTFNDINAAFNKICGYSVHTHQTDIRNGFITIEGGHRVGFCGTAVVDDNNKIVSVKDINSINLRISKQHIGVSQKIIQKVLNSGLKSIIIAGPPLSGKTTILRDLARNLSAYTDEYNNICVVDERNEIAAVSKGNIFNDMGICCDVLSGYPKADGIIIALRTLSPDLIICDEIGDMTEVNAIKNGLNSGVKFIISVHAGDKKELMMRPQISELIKTEAFEDVVLLKGRTSPGEIFKIIETSDLKNEIFIDSNPINYKRIDRIFI